MELTEFSDIPPAVSNSIPRGGTVCPPPLKALLKDWGTFYCLLFEEPQRAQRTQRKAAQLCALCVLCG